MESKNLSDLYNVRQKIASVLKASTVFHSSIQTGLMLLPAFPSSTTKWPTLLVNNNKYTRQYGEGMLTTG